MKKRRFVVGAASAVIAVAWKSGPARIAAEAAPATSMLHRGVAGLCLHTAEPGANMGKRGQVETAVTGAMGVCVQRDVGDAIALADKPLAPRQMLLHHRQYLRAFLQQRRHFGLTRVIRWKP